MDACSAKSLIDAGFLKLDIEFGNSFGFFSAKKSGFADTFEHNSYRKNSWTAKIPTAEIQLLDMCALDRLTLMRCVTFKPCLDAVLYDMVSRFEVLSNDRQAHIAGRRISHTSSNIYYQYEVNKVVVPIGNFSYLKFTDARSNAHPYFDNVFYVRDEAVDCEGNKRWIVHHRMIVKENKAKLTLRCCYPPLEGPVPAQRVIPRFIKKFFFRIRERQFPSFPFMAVGEAKIKKNTEVNIRTRIEILHD